MRRTGPPDARADGAGAGCEYLNARPNRIERVLPRSPVTRGLRHLRMGRPDFANVPSGGETLQELVKVNLGAWCEVNRLHRRQACKLMLHAPNLATRANPAVGAERPAPEDSTGHSLTTLRAPKSRARDR